mgnify:CR=1 FL=1
MPPPLGLDRVIRRGPRGGFRRCARWGSSDALDPRRAGLILEALDDHACHFTPARWRRTVCTAEVLGELGLFGRRRPGRTVKAAQRSRARRGRDRGSRMQQRGCRSAACAEEDEQSKLSRASSHAVFPAKECPKPCSLETGLHSGRGCGVVPDRPLARPRNRHRRPLLRPLAAPSPCARGRGRRGRGCDRRGGRLRDRRLARGRGRRDRRSPRSASRAVGRRGHSGAEARVAAPPCLVGLAAL